MRANFSKTFSCEHGVFGIYFGIWGFCAGSWASIKSVENTPEFPRKIPKKYPPSLNSGLPEFTPKIPENTEKQKCPFGAFFRGIFSGYFRGIFGVFSWGSRISARGVFFRYFSWKSRVGPSRGSVTPKGPFRTKNSTESKFTTAREKRSGKSKTLRIVLRSACFSKKKRQENGTDAKRLRP